MAGKILVTGATGNVSSGLIPELIAKGASVRALVRDPAKAQGLRDQGVEVVIGDFDKPETLDAAFSGVDKVFLVTAPNPDQVTQARNGIAAAKRAGSPYIVRLSAGALDTTPDAPARITRQHAETDAELKATGLDYTILRPHFFMQNTLMAAGTVASEGVMYMPLKDGKIGMIDVRDIVDVAAKVLTEDGHQGKTYGLTGPASISFHDVAAGLSKALGKDVKYVDVPLEAGRKAWETSRRVMCSSSPAIRLARSRRSPVTSPRCSRPLPRPSSEVRAKEARHLTSLARGPGVPMPGPRAAAAVMRAHLIPDRNTMHDDERPLGGVAVAKSA